MAFWIVYLLAALWPYPQKVDYTKFQGEKDLCPYLVK